MTVSKVLGMALGFMGAVSMFLLTLIFNTLHSNVDDIQANAVHLSRIDESVRNIDIRIKNIESKLRTDHQLYAYVEVTDGSAE